MVYGEEDLVLGIVSFLEEIGVDTVLAATGSDSPYFAKAVSSVKQNKTTPTIVATDADFEQMNEMADDLKPDIFIGHSKGYYITRRLGIPLIRIGFPIHDRIGAQRVQHIGYAGTQQLFDRIHLGK